MPDWLTHMGIAYVVIWGISKIPELNSKLRAYFWLFIIGMVAPDIERFFTVVAQVIDNAYFTALTFTFITVTHSILGVAIISLFITSFFPHEQQRDTKFIYLTLFIGGLGHLMIDLIMWPWPGMGLNLFYPLAGSEFSYSFHLVWPWNFTPLFITSIILLGTVLIDAISRNFSVFRWQF